MKTPGIFIAVLAVYCICALCIGMSSAADVTMSTAHHNSTFYAGPGHRLSSETIIANHEHKSVNESVVKTALRNGNNATAMTWLEKDGANVTGFKDDLQNGNTDAARTLSENYFQTHKPGIGAGVRRAGFDLTNATRQQQIITRHEKDGINVTGFKADLLNGNIDAAKALLDAYLQVHRNNVSVRMKSR